MKAVMYALGVVSLMVLVPAAAVAQQTGTITGRVTDAQTGQPVSAVQVFITALDQGSLTQQNGSYLLVNVSTGEHTVSVQRIGYRAVTQTATVTAGGTTVLDFRITEEALRLDEVIVTGTPGGTQRRALGNAITQVDVAEVTSRVAISTTQDLLSARTPGLQLTRVASDVGQSSTMTIRGVGSFSLSANPLIYVDGVRIQNTAVGPQLGPGFSTGGSSSQVLNDINPEDIESIEVIKGPAAATLYGTEASAGVIQIITKKGQAGAPAFEFSVRQGTNFIADPAWGYTNRVVCATALSAPCPAGDLLSYNMYDESTWYIENGYFPWPKETLYSYGHSQQYDLGVRGGTDNVRYYVSGDYLDDQGTLWWNTNESYRFRANLTAVFSENLTLDVSSGYISGDTRYGGPLGLELSLKRASTIGRGRCIVRLNLDSCPRSLGYADARPDDLSKIEVTRAYDRVTSSATLNHTAGGWFNQRLVLGIDQGWETNERLYPKETQLTPLITQSINGELDRWTPNTRNVSFDYAASAEYQFNEQLSFTTSVGGQYYTERHEDTGLFGKNLATEFSTTINQTAANQLSLQYAYEENKSLGVYVQEELNWGDRIFLTGAVRLDDNSAFGADFDAQVYPKLSAAWVISEESFWNVGPVNSLRVRGALGKAGRQPSTFSGISTYTTFRGTGGRSGIRPASAGDPDVGPEVSTEIELGFDVALLNDRLAGDFTYFHQRNEDALLSRGVAGSSGFPGSIEQNAGRIDNWGWEASLNARLYQSRNVSFDLAVSADYTMNEIKSLGFFQGSNSVRVGQPYPGATTSYRVLEAQLTQPGQYTGAMCDSGIQLGSDDLADSQRGVSLGGPAAPCAQVGDLDLLLGPEFWTNTFTVSPTIGLLDNSLQVYASAQGMYGRWSEDSMIQYMHLFQITEKSWLLDDPIWLAGCAVGCAFPDQTVDRSYKGNFWRMREIGARYTLPESVVSRIGADRASLALSGRNLFKIWWKQDTLAGMPITDPEIGTNFVNGDNNYFEAPPASSFHATLRVTF